MFADTPARTPQGTPARETRATDCIGPPPGKPYPMLTDVLGLAEVYLLAGVILFAVVALGACVLAGFSGD